MRQLPAVLTGTAGEHFVAYRLTAMGLLVALTRGGSPTVDLMVSDIHGKKAISVQVKTTEYALRERGRGKERKPHHLEFPLGFKSARINEPNFFFAFVDMKALHPNEIPDVYIVPSEFVYKWCASWIDNVKMVRFHIPLEQIEQYKNNFERLRESLLAG